MSMRHVKAPVPAPDLKTAVSAASCVTCATALAGWLVLRDAGLWPQVPDVVGPYDLWMAVAPALGGLASYLIARGWIGAPGLLGTVRACFGAVVMLTLAALIGGSLIMPVYGTFYAPFIVLTAFLAAPLLAVVWGGGILAAHWILLREDTRRRAILSEQEEQAQSSLSPLSQAYFYRK